MVRPWRDLADDEPHRRRHGGHVPDDPRPPRDRRAGGRDDRDPAAGTLRARARHRGESERARRRRRLAAGRHASRDARGGDRRDPAAVAGRRPQPPRHALRRGERAAVLAARPAAADHGCCEQDRRGGARGARRRRDDHHAGQRRPGRALPVGRRQGPAVPCRDQRLLGQRRAFGAAHRARGVGARGAARSALHRARGAVAFRGGVVADRRGRGRTERRLRSRPRRLGRAHPRGRACRSHARLHPPDRPRPGGVLPLLGARAGAPARRAALARRRRGEGAFAAHLPHDVRGRAAHPGRRSAAAAAEPVRGARPEEVAAADSRFGTTYTRAARRAPKNAAIPPARGLPLCGRRS